MLLRVLRGATLALRGLHLAVTDGCVVHAYRRFGLGYLLILGLVYALSSAALLLVLPLAIVALPTLSTALPILLLCAIGALALGIASALLWWLLGWTSLSGLLACLRPLGVLIAFGPTLAFWLSMLLMPRSASEFAILGAIAAEARSSQGVTGARSPQETPSDCDKSCGVRLREERRSLGRLHAICVTVLHALVLALTLHVLSRAGGGSPGSSVRVGGAVAGGVGDVEATAAVDAAHTAPTGLHRARACRALGLGLGWLSTGVQAARIHLQANRACSATQQLRLARQQLPELLGFGCALQCLMALPVVGLLGGLGLGAYASGVLAHGLGNQWLFAAEGEAEARQALGLGHPSRLSESDGADRWPAPRGRARTTASHGTRDSVTVPATC